MAEPQNCQDRREIVSSSRDRLACRHCRIVSAAMFGLVVTVGVDQATAANVSWLPTGSGSWSVAGNWSSNPALPGATDDVTIAPPASTVTVSGDRSVHSIAAAGNLLVNDVALRLAADSVVNGRFDVVSPQPWFWAPTIQSAGNLQLNGGGSWMGGIFSGPGVTTIAAGSTFTTSPQGYLYLNGGHTLQNAGTLNYDLTIGGQTWDLTSGTLVNLAGGTFNVLTEPETVSGGALGGFGIFANAGTLNKLGPREWQVGTRFNNTGTVNVAGGKLTLVNSDNTYGGTFNVSDGATLAFYGGTFTGTYTASGAAALVFAGGTHAITPTATFSGPVSLMGGRLRFTGGDNTLPEGFGWRWGVLTGAGKTVLPAGRTLEINPTGGTADLTGRTFENAGTVNLNASNWGMFLSSAVFRNLPDATINANSDPIIGGGGYVGGSIAPNTYFDNAGTVNKTGPGSWTVYVYFSNAGTLNVRAGTIGLSGVLQLSGSTLTGGTWNVSNDATLGISSGSNIDTIGPAASVTLGGPNAVFAKINSLANVQGSFTLSGGRSFTTTGALTNSGAIAVGAGSTLKVAGTFASSGTLTNSGTIDIVGNRMILNYASASPADWLRGQLQSGRNGGAWAGAAGVVSSTAAGDALKRKAIGYAEAADLGVTTWAGVAVDATALLTKVTWYGDANLDGKVNADDYALLDRSMAKGLTGAHWADGDFDYSGTVDQADYLLADRVYGQQVGVLSPELLADREARFGSAYVTELIAAVPEPSILAPSLATLGGLLTSRRRRRI